MDSATEMNATKDENAITNKDATTNRLLHTVGYDGNTFGSFNTEEEAVVLLNEIKNNPKKMLDYHPMATHLLLKFNPALLSLIQIPENKMKGLLGETFSYPSQDAGYLLGPLKRADENVKCVFFKDTMSEKEIADHVVKYLRRCANSFEFACEGKSAQSRMNTILATYGRGNQKDDTTDRWYIQLPNPVLVKWLVTERSLLLSKPDVTPTSNTDTLVYRFDPICINKEQFLTLVQNPEFNICKLRNTQTLISESTTTTATRKRPSETDITFTLMWVRLDPFKLWMDRVVSHILKEGWKLEIYTEDEDSIYGDGTGKSILSLEKQRPMLVVEYKTESLPSLAELESLIDIYPRDGGINLKVKTEDNLFINSWARDYVLKNPSLGIKIENSTSWNASPNDGECYLLTFPHNTTKSFYDESISKNSTFDR